MKRMANRRLVPALMAGVLLAGSAAGAERFDLREDAGDARGRGVAVSLAVNGKLFPAPGPDRALKLTVDARFAYSERRLSGTGRDAETLRSVRHYEGAQAKIQAGDQHSHSVLRGSQRLVVARGQLDGLDLFCPSGPFTYNELELLRVPADSLAVLALLPDSQVELDETWTAPEWCLPLLTGIEAVEKGKITCKLESVEEHKARIGFRGEVSGAAVGASAVIELAGSLLFDLERKIVVRIEATQSEKRAIGAVSPGLDVVAKVEVARAIAEGATKITEKDLAGVPLEPNAASRLLLFDAGNWHIRLYHDRHWHVFHQASDGALLRLLDQGGFMAQCNLKKLPDAEPGQHVPEKQFQRDIQESLGKNFEQFVQTEKLNLKDGLYVYRVVAAGSVTQMNEKKEPEASPMHWIYYLVANPEGRQLSFVFSVDARQAKDFGSRDLSMVSGVEFLRVRAQVTPAADRRKN